MLDILSTDPVVRMQAYCDQMASFIDVIGGRPGLVGTGEDGRKAVAVCRAMLASSSARQWVHPEPGR